MVVLPFDSSPLLTHYLGKAFSLGIIQGNAEETALPWIYSRYINCIYNATAANKFDFYTPDYWGRGDGILAEQRMILQRETYQIMKLDILDFVRNLLDRAYYVYGTNNERYIPGKSSYQQRDFLHEYLLYGYSDEQQIFHSCGYLADNKYQVFEISYDDYLKSLMNTTDGMIKFSFWNYCPNAKFPLDMKHIIIELGDYILSRNTQRAQQPGLIYGVRAVESLQDYLRTEMDQGHYADIRYTKAFWGHKKLTAKRFAYLHEHGYSMKPEWLNLATKHEKMAEQIHLLCIKQNLKHTTAVSKKVYDLFSTVLEEEKKYLPAVLEALKIHMCDLQ